MTGGSIGVVPGLRCTPAGPPGAAPAAETARSGEVWAAMDMCGGVARLLELPIPAVDAVLRPATRSGFDSAAIMPRACAAAEESRGERNTGRCGELPCGVLLWRRCGVVAADDVEAAKASIVFMLLFVTVERDSGAAVLPGALRGERVSGENCCCC